MRVHYIGPHARVSVPLPDGSAVEVDRDGTTDVPDEIGASLCEQSTWGPATPAKGPAAPATTNGSER